VLAFRGMDSNLYTSTLSLATDTWGAPELFGGGIAIASGLAIDTGIQGTGVDAELAFVTADTGEVFHSRLVNDVWTSPVLVGGWA
jgi:hypothetical protein